MRINQNEFIFQDRTLAVSELLKMKVAHYSAWLDNLMSIGCLKAEDNVKCQSLLDSINPTEDSLSAIKLFLDSLYKAYSGNESFKRIDDYYRPETPEIRKIKSGLGYQIEGGKKRPKLMTLPLSSPPEATQTTTRSDVQAVMNQPTIQSNSTLFSSAPKKAVMPSPLLAPIVAKRTKKYIPTKEEIDKAIRIFLSGDLSSFEYNSKERAAQSWRQAKSAHYLAWLNKLIESNCVDIEDRDQCVLFKNQMDTSKDTLNKFEIYISGLYSRNKKNALFLELDKPFRETVPILHRGGYGRSRGNYTVTNRSEQDKQQAWAISVLENADDDIISHVNERLSQSMQLETEKADIELGLEELKKSLQNQSSYYERIRNEINYVLDNFKRSMASVFPAPEPQNTGFFSIFSSKQKVQTKRDEAIALYELFKEVFKNLETEPTPENAAIIKANIEAVKNNPEMLNLEQVPFVIKRATYTLEAISDKVNDLALCREEIRIITEKIRTLSADRPTQLERW